MNTFFDQGEESFYIYIDQEIINRLKNRVFKIF